LIVQSGANRSAQDEFYLCQPKQPILLQTETMKQLIVLLLLLPLIAAISLLPDPTDASYRADMRFESSGALPGELSANDSDLISRPLAENLLDHIVIPSCPGRVDFRVRCNNRRVFYETVPIHKLKAVFVI
jgi:hypothetical protein